MKRGIVKDAEGRYIGDGRDESAPTEARGMLLISIYECHFYVKK